MIRFAVEGDLPAILEIYAPYVLTTTYTFEYEVPTLEVFTQRFRAITVHCPWVVWEEDGKILGYAYGSLPFERAAYSWCGELSVYLAPEARGRGIGRAMYAYLEDIMEKQGFRVIYVLITSENAPSLAFHERVGYTLTCQMPRCGYKFGRWLGIIWMEKRIGTGEHPEKMPVSWREVVNFPEK